MATATKTRAGNSLAGTAAMSEPLQLVVDRRIDEARRKYAEFVERFATDEGVSSDEADELEAVLRRIDRTHDDLMSHVEELKAIRLEERLLDAQMKSADGKPLTLQDLEQQTHEARLNVERIEEELRAARSAWQVARHHRIAIGQQAASLNSRKHKLEQQLNGKEL